MAQVYAIRHVHFEDMGTLGELLAERGHSVRYVEAWRGDFSNLEEADLLVVLGGPIGAASDNAYPFLAQELKVLQRRLSTRGPTLGICLGAQLVAKALGASVRRGNGIELGWGPISLTSAGVESSLNELADEGEHSIPVFHWHSDTFDIPEGAVCLAESVQCSRQAFRVGRNVMALQFHPEVQRPSLEAWWVGHTAELQQSVGLAGLGSLRSTSERCGGELERRARRMFSRWLEEVGL